MRRKILIKVWQGVVSPEQALRAFETGNEREARILELLVALKNHEITVNETEEEIAEEEELCDENRPHC